MTDVFIIPEAKIKPAITQVLTEMRITGYPVTFDLNDSANPEGRYASINATISRMSHTCDRKYITKRVKREGKNVVQVWRIN